MLRFKDIQNYQENKSHGRRGKGTIRMLSLLKSSHFEIQFTLLIGDYLSRLHFT